MRGKIMKKLLAVLVVAGLFGSVPVLAVQEITCSGVTYTCEWDEDWGTGYTVGGLCSAQKVSHVVVRT